MSLLPIPETAAEWHALRAKHVGASEVAILFGVAPEYAPGLRALWEIKAGHVPPPQVDNKRTRWGLRLEDAIAEAAAEEEGWTVLPGQYASLDGLGATLDRIAVCDEHDAAYPGPGCLELKNSDWLQHKRTWGDEPPPHILLQLQAQLAATGYQWGAIACLIGGNDLKIYPYLARPKLQADILRRVAAFWQSIREGKPPRADGSDATYRALIQLSPEIAEAGAELDNDNEAPVLAVRYLEVAEAERAAKKEREEIRNRLLEKLGAHRFGHTPGFRISQVVTAATAPRAPKPGEMIGGRAESRSIKVVIMEDAA